MSRPFVSQAEEHRDAATTCTARIPASLPQQTGSIDHDAFSSIRAHGMNVIDFNKVEYGVPQRHVPAAWLHDLVLSRPAPALRHLPGQSLAWFSPSTGSNLPASIVQKSVCQAFPLNAIFPCGSIAESEI